MKRIRGGVVVSFVALIIGVLVGSPAFAAKGGSKAAKAPSEPFEKRFAVSYGKKTLNKSDWEPANENTGYEAEAEFWKPDWPVSALVTYFKGDGSGTITNYDFDGDIIADGDAKADLETTEIGIGVRKWLDGGDTFALFVEGGAVSIDLKASLKMKSTSDSWAHSGSGTGYWIGAGLNYPVSDTWSVGGIARMSQGDIKVGGVNTSGGGTILMLTLQYYAEN